MKDKKTLALAVAFVIGATLISGVKTHASPNDYSGDYDAASGEPKCFKCHTAETRYNVDYTRDESCVECHGPGLSDRYLEINRKFRTDVAEVDVNTDAPAVSGIKGIKAATGKPKKPGTRRDMALIPAGEFTMGSDEWWPKSQPAHKRDLKAYYIDKYEVTNGRYRTFVDATGRPAPDHWVEGNIPDGREKHPVVYVTWHDADEFCRWEGKRLPTEAEWEKAARGTDGRNFPWGNKFDKNMGNTPQLGRGDTMPVGSFEKGKSPYGLYDMAGNAFEWTADSFKPYPGSKHRDENLGKTLRGGSWFDCTTYKCGISSPTYNRIAFNPSTKNNTFGFRCAADR